MRVIQVDDSRWPLVVYTFDGQQTDDDVEWYLERLGQIFLRRKPFVSLTHIRDYAPKVAHVNRVGAFVNSHKEADRAFNRASAVVIASPAFRFILSSFYLISRISHPHLVCEDTATAETWLTQRMIELGLGPPPKR